MGLFITAHGDNFYSPSPERSTHGPLTTRPMSLSKNYFFKQSGEMVNHKKAMGQTHSQLFNKSHFQTTSVDRP